MFICERVYTCTTLTVVNYNIFPAMAIKKLYILPL